MKQSSTHNSSFLTDRSEVLGRVVHVVNKRGVKIVTKISQIWVNMH
jgi:hypothetical protein